MIAGRAAAAFAIPGDIATVTGGYIYERRLLNGLRALGHPVAHLELGEGFPFPSAEEMSDAIAQMTAVDPAHPLIVDGLVFGSVDGLENVPAPLIAMIHHPLALEEGLSAADAQHLYQTERANVALARHILVPSPHTRTILIEDYGANPERITIAPPGVDRPLHAPAPSDPPLILSVGILHPRKGHDVLLDALADIRALDWRAVIVGREHDPDHAASLRRQCTEHGLDDRVEITGQISAPALEKLYRSATLFALATRYEGYGMVFAEALAHGLPIVATQGGAVPQTVPTGAGRLVRVGDAPAFASALRALLADPETRATLRTGAEEAGQALPIWKDTAEIASRVLQGAASEL